MNPETTTIRPPEKAAVIENGVGKHQGAASALFVALLLLGLLAGGAWASAQPLENGRVVDPSQGGDVPAARLHPRGLPRRGSGNGSRLVTRAAREKGQGLHQRGERT